MPDVRIPFVMRLLHPIPSCAVSILRDNVIIISFSERVIDFTEADIEITGGTISDFIGNGREFCITIETSTTAEIYVPAGICQSENGIPNAASPRFVYEG